MHWTEPAAWATFAIAIAGVHLNNRRLRACFALWWISNAASFAIHIDAGMAGMAARDAAFFAMAVVGFRKWGKRTAVSTDCADSTEAKRGKRP